MHPYVAQRRGAEDGVGNGVGKDVCVGVALETEVAGYPNAAQNERPSRHQPVDVPADAGPELAHDTLRSAISSARNSRARSMSEGLVIFRLRSLPRTTLTSA